MTEAGSGRPSAGVMPRGGSVPTTYLRKGSSRAKPAELGWRMAGGHGEAILAGLLGLAGACLVVATAGRLALRSGVELPTDWFGLLIPVQLDRASALPAFMIIGVALLVIGWLQLCLLARRGSVSLSQTGIIIAVWCLPIAVGPPILSLDIYSYVAHGAMLTADLNPYRNGPNILGNQPSLLASDPVWRMSRAPYGPLALALLKAAYGLSGGTVLGTVLILRALALAGVIVILGCVARAADPRRRPLALAAAGSPVVILQLLGAVHLEAIMVALLAAGLLAARAGRPIASMMLLTAATAVKWPAAFAIVAVAVWHAGTPVPDTRPRNTGPPDARPPHARAWVWARLRPVARDVGVVSASGLVLVLLIPDGLGWLRSAATPASGLTLYAPTVGLADGLARLGDIADMKIQFAQALNLTRTAGIVVTAGVMLRLLATIRARNLAATVGWGLLTLAVLGPVLYPWYLTWGLIPLAMATDRIRLSLLGTVSAVGAFLALPHCELLFANLPGATPWLQRQAPVIAISTLFLVLISVVILTRRRDSWSTTTLKR